MGGADLAGLTINHRQRVAGIVDEQLLPATVALPHRQWQSSLPAAEQVAIPAVPVSVGMLGYILIPENLKRHQNSLSQIWRELRNTQSVYGELNFVKVEK